jgi:hypothetical protein
MPDADLPPEISRLYDDLAGRIIARDEDGASRIYQELLHNGRPLQILAEAMRVPALRKTLEPELSGQRSAEEQGSKIPDDPPQQGGTQSEAAARSIIERAVERVDQTIGPEISPPTPRILDDVSSERSPSDLTRVSRLRLGPRVGATRLPPIAHLCLATVLIAATAGAGIFLMTHPAAKNDAAESTPVKEASIKTSEDSAPTRSPAMKPLAGSAVQPDALAGPAPVAASALAPESEGSLILGAPLSMAPTGEPVSNTTAKPDVSTPGVASTVGASALATPSGKPEANAATVAAAPTAEGTSTGAKPPSKPGFSRTAVPALLARGDALFGTGDVASARLFYERVADMGEAKAAVRLAETFDPVFLDYAHLRGVRGDPDMALFWYRRARDLGAKGVERELKRLERNGEGTDP